MPLSYWMDTAQSAAAKKLALSTITRYEHKWPIWSQFCASYNWPPIINDTKNAQLLGIAFTAFLFKGKNKHYGVIVQCRCAVTRVYNLNNLPGPFTDSPLGDSLLSAIKRAQPPPKKKEAISLEDLCKAITWIRDHSNWNDKEHIILAFILGFECLLRVSELAIPTKQQEQEWYTDMRALIWQQVTCYSTYCDILIKMRKNDQTKKGHVVRVHSTDKYGKQNNPFLLLLGLRRLARLRRRSTLLMQCNANGEDVRPLLADTVRERLATACEIIGLERGSTSTTSLRSGGVSDKFAEGWTGVQIALLGGWKSDAFNEYIQRSIVLRRMFTIPYVSRKP